MPQARQYERQEQEKPVPGVRVSTEAPLEAFGGGPSYARTQKATGDLASTIQDVRDEERRKANALSNVRNDGELQRVVNDILWNPETGAMNKLGEDSFALPELVRKEFSDRTKDVEKRLVNDDQRQAYVNIRAAHERDLEVQIQRHVSKQRENYWDAETKSKVALMHETAIKGTNYLDETKVEEQIQLADQALMTYADFKGWPPKAIELERKQSASAIYRDVLKRRMNTDPEGGVAYFEKIKDRMTDRDLMDIEPVMTEGKLRGEVQSETDRIWNKHGAKVVSLTDMKTGRVVESEMEKANFDAMFADAAKESDPKKRKAIEGMLDERYSRYKRMQGELQDQTERRISEVIERTGDASQVSIEDWVAARPGYRSSMEARARQVREGVEPVTDRALYYQLRKDAVDPEKQQGFASLNLLEYKHKLDFQKFDELVGIQTSLRSKDGKAQKAIDGYRTVDSVVNGTLNSFGIGLDKAREADDAVVTERFKEAVDREIAKWRADHKGMEIGSQEATEIVKNLTGNLVDSYVGKNKVIPAILLSDAERADAIAKNVPSQIMVVLRKHARASGLNPDGISEEAYRRATAIYFGGGSEEEILEKLKKGAD